MYIPFRGLCTSMTEPSAAVRTTLPVRVWVSVLPAGPGWPRKLRDCTARAFAWLLVSDAIWSGAAALRALPAAAAALRVLPGAVTTLRVLIGGVATLRVLTGGVAPLVSP